MQLGSVARTPQPSLPIVTVGSSNDTEARRAARPLTARDHEHGSDQRPSASLVNGRAIAYPVAFASSNVLFTWLSYIAANFG